MLARNAHRIQVSSVTVLMINALKKVQARGAKISILAKVVTVVAVVIIIVVVKILNSYY